MKGALIGLFFLMSLSSCDYLQFKKDTTTEAIPVARVGEEFLYKKDIQAFFSKLSDKKDSAKQVNAFVEDWARKQILLQKAKLNLSAEKMQVLQQMIDEYKEDLYINSYKDELVAQQLDTTIPAEKIESYYKANNPIFNLRNVILKFRYLSFISDTWNEKELQKQFLSLSSEALDSLVQANELKFTDSYTNDSVWVDFKDYMRINPILSTLNINKLLYKKDNSFVLKDSMHTHFLWVKDYRRIGEIAPVDKVAPDIEQMILHTKKRAFFKEIDKKLMEEAINNKTYIRYE